MTSGSAGGAGVPARRASRSPLSRLLIVLIATTTVSTLASVVTATLAFVSHVEARALREELDAKWAEATKPRVVPVGVVETEADEVPLPSMPWPIHEGNGTRSIERALIDRIPTVDGTRVVPSFEGGKLIGFKVFSIRPGSAYAELGLMNGDTIGSVNGLALSSPEAALAAYAKLKDASTFEVDVRRRGKWIKLNYAVEEVQP